MLKLTRKNKFILKKNVLKISFAFVYKLLLSDSFVFDLVSRGKIRKYFNKINEFLSLISFKKNCYVSGRSRSRSLFNLSRFKIKSLAWEGLLVGLKRLSW